MSALDQAHKQLQRDFTLSTAQLHKLAASFDEDMTAGLAGEHRSLAMLPSWLSCPTGNEQGQYVALDFGGTNVRALLVELRGRGDFTILSHISSPLAEPSAGYDYTTATTTAEELFDFIARLLAVIVSPNNNYLLGHTFSFPCSQQNVNTAILLYWTKEIATSGVVAHNVTDLLQQALVRHKLDHIRPVAVVNDTVTTLLTAAYGDNCADIGSICGTGHNTCYLEPNYPGISYPMYINIEAGNFDKAPTSRYDDLLDAKSDRPGAGRLEKMCSGRYIGELFRLLWLELSQQGLLPNNPLTTHFKAPYTLSGQHLALLLIGDSTWLTAKSPTCPEKTILRAIAEKIVIRSARLVAATWLAVLMRIDPGVSRQHTIAIDGSLYEKMPGYAAAISATLQELLGPKAVNINCRLTKDSSGVGAAIAAAIANAQQKR